MRQPINVQREIVRFLRSTCATRSFSVHRCRAASSIRFLESNLVTIYGTSEHLVPSIVGFTTTIPIVMIGNRYGGREHPQLKQQDRSIAI